MKRNKIILLLLVLFGTSCSKDFLETQPSGANSNENAFKTRSDFETALNGCYSALQDVGYYGRNYQVIGEILADNIKPSTDNLARFTDLYNHSQTPSDQYLKELWKSGYAVIHRCNTLIKATKQDSTILDDSERDRILGQAFGLRAMAHFDLFNVFSPRYDAATAHEMLAIPLIVDTTFDMGIVPMPRSTAEQVFKQIKKDLANSDTLLKDAGFSPFYFNKYAAMALHARVSLWTSDYIGAFAYANKVITSGDLSLISNSDYADSWKQPFTSESIFSISFDQNDFSGTEGFAYLYSEKGYGDVIPTSDITRLFSTTDVRRKIFSNGHCAKFQNDENVIGLANFPVLRLSEMYLIIAESTIRLKLSKTINLADEDIIQIVDEIRKRADASAGTTDASGTALLEKILVERRKELCFEGLRFFDIKRTQTAVVRQDCGSQACVLDYLNSPQRFTMPIPISEINANPNISQNEGY